MCALAHWIGYTVNSLRLMKVSINAHFTCLRDRFLFFLFAIIAFLPRISFIAHNYAIFVFRHGSQSVAIVPKKIEPHFDGARQSLCWRQTHRTISDEKRERNAPEEVCAVWASTCWLYNWFSWDRILCHHCQFPNMKWVFLLDGRCSIVFKSILDDKKRALRSVHWHNFNRRNSRPFSVRSYVGESFFIPSYDLRTAASCAIEFSTHSTQNFKAIKPHILLAVPVLSNLQLRSYINQELWR